MEVSEPPSGVIGFVSFDDGIQWEGLWGNSTATCPISHRRGVCENVPPDCAVVSSGICFSRGTPSLMQFWVCVRRLSPDMAGPDERTNTNERTTRPDSGLLSLLSYVPAIACMAALILGCVQNFSCKTVTFPQTRNTGYGNLDAGPFLFRLRVLYTNTGDGDWLVDVCRSYKDLTDELGFGYDEDAMTIAVRTFAVAATFLGGLATALICLVPLYGRTTGLSTWRSYGGVLILTGIVQGLTLLVTRSSICTNNPALQVFDDAGWSVANTFTTACQTSTGYGSGIAATALWLTTGIMMFCLSPPKRVDEEWVTSFGYWGMPKNRNPKWEEDEQSNGDEE